MLDSRPQRLEIGRGYIGSLAKALAEYPRDVALRCADPVHGVLRDCKYVPVVPDIVAWCEKQTEPLRQHAAWQRRAARQIAARDAPRDDRLTYDELKAKYPWPEYQKPQAKPSDWHAPTDDELRAIYGTRDDAEI